MRIVVLLLLACGSLWSQAWTLKSGGVEYRLRLENQAVRLEYFGPSGLASWRLGAQRRGGPLPAYDIRGAVDGRPIEPERLELKSHQSFNPRPGIEGLRLVYRHRDLPLEIETQYAAWGETGVFTRRIALTNTGARTLRVESLPELALRLPPGDYDFTYMWGGWGQEKQVATEKVVAGRRVFASPRGRSTSIYSPWFSLYNASLGVRYLADFAYSGNWQMIFERLPGSGATRIEDTDLQVSLGSLFDFEGALALPPGARRELPAVAFTATTGDLDDAANQLHRYQRSYVFPRVQTNDPLLVQFNSWYPFPGKMTVDEMKRCADAAAAIGSEVFVLDSGWYNKKDWSRELGDYEVDRVAFPNGLEELSKHVHSRNMKFGLWVEIENVGIDSQMIRKHPDWLLSFGGKPLIKGVRAMLDFAKPEVRAWAHSVMDRLVRDYQLEWVKIDYNIDIGAEFDPASPSERPGTVLMDHVRHYYQWLDEVRARHPALVIENCSSGGLRFDTGIMAHTHTTWISDVVAPLPSVQLAYGCTLAFAPSVCNHWMVGDIAPDGHGRGYVDLKAPPGWWDFQFRVPMNGQFGISSRIFDWTPELIKRAAENVALYKRIRTVIADADVYHLTPPSSHDAPTGWMALEYVSQNRKRGVLTAYRLGDSAARQVFPLRGLDPAAWYRISLDGKAQPRLWSAQELSAKGLPVQLDAEWRAVVIELEKAE